MPAFHHALKHERVTKTKNQPYRWLDYATYAVAFIGPAFTLPQAYDVWVLHDAKINLFTWSSYILFALIWLCYGITHRARPIILSNLLWLSVDLTVLIGVLLRP